MSVKPISYPLMEKIVALSRRRGFVFQSSEIYDGINAVYDYGPMGVELKRNVKNLWWQDMITSRENVLGMDTAIMMHPRVWEASGHVNNFHDPMTECKKCKRRYRVDHLPTLRDKLIELISDYDKNELENISKLLNVKLTNYFENNNGLFINKIPIDQLRILNKVLDLNENINFDDYFPICPECKGELAEPKQFNLMFKTKLGSTDESALDVYLRPETAQGIFVNFNNIVSSNRVKLPFGIGQLGKAFRNEITTGNFIFKISKIISKDTKLWLSISNHLSKFMILLTEIIKL